MEIDSKLDELEQRRVKLMRLQSNQATIARRLNVTLSFFNKWLHGKRNSARLERDFERLYQRRMKESKNHA